jgi:phenylalanyl-tRNA synthetase beta chain
MKIVLSWLNELAPVGADADALAELMNDLGLAVDDVDAVGQPVEGVIVARVLALRPHPDANHVQRVDLDTGDGESLQVWCGAFNMQVGDLVPLATVGTTMPNGMKIGRRKILGEPSNGMLCSPDEIGFGAESGGILILPADVPVGSPLWEALAVDADVVFDLDLTRNRPDAYSHAGVARDLAARLGVSLTLPDPTIEIAGPSTGVDVTIVDGKGCGRFTARVVTGVRVTESPTWIADRLTRAGMRPINNVVDVSNYVMLELGQPNHTYDLAKLEGGGFRIRKARDGETIVTLDEVEREVTSADVLICDGNDVAIGIGGVMGGLSTEIDEHTTSVALEMAWFDPPTIAATAGRLALRSEASTRFERGADPEVADRAARRFVDLLRLTCPDARLHSEIDARGELPSRAPVPLRRQRVNALLGTTLSVDDITRLLRSIGFEVEPGPTDEIVHVTIPTWRYDCTVEVDLIEEVARMHGYSRIARTVPKSPSPGGLSAVQQDRRLLREVMVGLGASEAMPNPFLAPGDLGRAGLAPTGISITNPLATEESVLRTSLLPGLLKAVAYNASHRNDDVSLFEIGHVYGLPLPGEPLPDEREMLAVALAGRDARAARAVWDEVAAALGWDAVAVAAGEQPGMHPTRTLLLGEGGELGAVGEVDPAALAAHGIDDRVAWVQLELDRLFAVPKSDRRYRPVSRFPSSDIDLAFVVAEAIPAGDVERTLRDAAGPLLVDLRLFDVYRGPSVGQAARSLAYALRLQAGDHTLTDAEVGEVRAVCIAAVEARHDAQLRG